MNELKLEEIEERKLWSKCSICNNEYSSDVRILPDCLHTFCYECILSTLGTSNMCPNCNTNITTPLSSLPPNFAIQTWLKLSPSSLISNQELQIYNNHSRRCEECEITNGEVYCKDCNRFYCLRCSSEVHLHKVMKTHSVGVVSKSQYRTLNSSLLHFYRCKKHLEEMRLFCEDCDDFVCVYCLDISEDHCNHNTISVYKFLDLIKEKWKKNLQAEIDRVQMIYPPPNKEENLHLKILQVNDEIEKLKFELQLKEHKKQIYQQKLEKLNTFQLHFDLTNRFLKSFFLDIPSLPLSSFLPKIPLQNDSKNIENNNNNFDLNSKRIRHFYERINIRKIYAALLPLPLADLDDIDDSNLDLISDLDFNNKKKKLSDYEINQRNKLLLANKLKPSKNLILFFGSEGKGDYKFQKVHYLAIDSESDLIAVSDCSNNSIQIFNMEGILQRHFTYYSISNSENKFNDNNNNNNNSLINLANNNNNNKKLRFKRPSGIQILSKQNLIAVADQNDHQILMIDLQSGDLKYTIGHGGKGNMKGQFNQPRGIAIINKYDIIAVCDCFNQRIQIFKLSSGEYQDSLSLNFRPYSIDLSKSAKLMMITDYDNHKVHIYSFTTDFQQNFYFRAIKEIGNYSPHLSNPRGIAIHPKANYFVVATRNELLFYYLSGDFICKFTPSPLLDYSRPLAVHIDRKENIIAVSDFFTCCIMLIKSPIF